jgi:hypothetical protein
MKYDLPGTVPMREAPQAVKHWRAWDPLDKERFLQAYSSVFWTPEKHLWLAVFSLAAEDIRKGWYLDAALSWVGSRGKSVGGFDYVCEVLGLDPEAARNALVKRKHLQRMTRVLVRGRPTVKFKHRKVKGIQPARYAGRSGKAV